MAVLVPPDGASSGDGLGIGNHFEIPGVRVRVVDGAIPVTTLSEIAQALTWVPMYFLKRVDRNPDAHPLDVYWYYPLVTVPDRYADDAAPLLDELPANLQVIQKLWQQVRSLIGGTVRLYECECTANSFGTEGHPHHDSPRSELRSQHITAIVYCNEFWRVEWAGETVILDERQDIHAAILPKSGRVCLIEGDPLHVARGISRTCAEARRVLVFKMWRSTD